MTVPKVLILNQPFNTDTGGGITLSNLFTGWDSQKLAVACSGYLLQDNIDTSICNTYYQLGEKEQVPVYQFLKSAIVRKYGQDFYDELDGAAQFLKESKVSG